MRYKLIMDKRFSSSGRVIKNINGALVVFKDGVAASVSEKTGNAAKKLQYVSEVIPFHETPKPKTPPQEESAVVAHVNVVADVKETEDGKLTADEIQSLYDSMGTWTAVAKYLGITTTTLRKYREETGLL